MNHPKPYIWKSSEQAHEQWSFAAPPRSNRGEERREDRVTEVDADERYDNVPCTD